MRLIFTHMLFINKRFCRFLPKVRESLGTFTDAMDQGEEMLSNPPILQAITKERLFYEMETKGNLKDLARQIVLQESQIQRQELSRRVTGDTPENTLANDVIDLIQQQKLADAESKVREEMRKNPAETKKILANYQLSLDQILLRFQAKEMTRDEAMLASQQALLKNPLIAQASKETGFPVEALAAGASGVFLDTERIPENPWDMVKGIQSSMEGLMHFRVAKRAAEKINVQESSIRAVYSINAQKFVGIVKMLKNMIDPSLPGSFVSESMKQKIQANLDNPSLDSDERRVMNFLLKDRGNSQELKKLYEYVGGRENIEFTLSEIDKTFEKKASLEKEAVSRSEIRRRSQDFFRENVDVGTMLKYKFQLKEDRETLASYTMASAFGTLPRAFQGQLRLRSMTGFFDKLAKNPDAAEEFTKLFKDTWKLNRGTFLKTQIEAEEFRKLGKASTQGAAEIGTVSEKAGKAARKTAGMGRYLKLVGPGMLVASEVYNVSTGRSTLPETVGRVAGGMLRFVPIVGTALDFTEAITGKDQINGQKLNRTERLARAGWGVLGALGDVAMLIPGAGSLYSWRHFCRTSCEGSPCCRSGNQDSSNRRFGRWHWRRRRSTVGRSPEMRGAVGVTGAIAVKTTEATFGAIRLMAGPSGGAADMDVAMASIKEKTGNTVKRASEAVADTTENVLKKYDITVAAWGAGSFAALKTYFKNPKNLPQLSEVKSILEKDKSKIAELKKIFTDPSLSIDKRHQQMKDFIERSKKSGEK